MNKKIIVWLFALPILFAGCDKFLEKEPENKVSIDVLFSDLAGAKAALTGVYTSLWSSNYYNGQRMVYPEAVSGNVKPLNTLRQTLIDIYSFTAQADSSSMNVVYREAYAILNNINNIIGRVPALEDGLQTEHNEIMAQAYGLRALLHLDLVQLYAQPYRYTADASHPGIIIATEPILIGNAQRKRATVAQVYTQIASDLERAQELFTNRKSVFTGNRVIYMNSSAVKALQGRVALHSGNWADAYDYSTALIVENFSLYSNMEYIASWTTSAGKETLFELAVPSAFAGNSLGNYYTNESANTYYQFVPSADLLEMFTTGDVRASGGIFKYPTYGTAATSVKLIRLSEMYLIRAESAAELGRNETALADLNTIRLRGNPALSAWTNADKTALLEEIMNERRRELCLEGIWFFDLTRRGLSVVRNDCEGNNCNLSYPSDRFVLPIPRQSVDSNGNMEQNQGY
ncbi:RagB/SusD family nutrient uptake outer membrane protein [Sphingobacterium alkalisoli]|uniref:RagB/SusD family nutrient uptake outer membrane protein n=1 Tax=Sphingobacterium alkalisoli TaxID=1874115 RepID=A0A4U0H546_9SPHI|nr:RagB/SusD family nutrient uptake outer membrane protein [Sphingobacterium alkalisoli]TJY66748.1 RagB/SusD family nutrient uptake outer membrane protein [Sphingobacterium alkalisoli]GGH14455.1 membrane protein [Sphingobacterium alkalisoli]